MPSFEAKKTTVIIAALAAIFALSAFAKTRLFESNASIDACIPGNPSTVIIGDSHARWGIDPSCIETSVNIAQETEFVMYSYYKLLKLLQSPNHIDKVILAYSYHTLAKRGDYAISELMKRYHLLLDAQFYRDLCKDEGAYTSVVLRYASDILGLPLGIANDIVEYTALKRDAGFNNLPYIGAYEARENSKIGKSTTANATIKRHFYVQEKKGDVSPMRNHYLRKLRQLCELHDIHLYLVNCPVHSSYYEKIPAKFIGETDKTGLFLENSLTTYINLSQMSLPDSCFYDYDHLNRQGAKIFSQHLNTLINHRSLE